MDLKHKNPPANITSLHILPATENSKDLSSFNEKRPLQEMHTIFKQEYAKKERKVKDSPPVDAIGLVGTAWALASQEDQNGNVKWIQSYLTDLIKDHKDDEHARDYFHKIIPILYGVVTKLGLARSKALASFDALDQRKKAELEKLNEISGVNASLQGITLRLAGLAGGGASAANFILGGSAGNNPLPLSDAAPEILVGVTVGYVVVEVALRIYKWWMTGKIEDTISKKKEEMWNDEFIQQAHLAILDLYNNASEIIQKQYNGSIQIKSRQMAYDFQKIANMFIQTPVFEGKTSRLTRFLEACSAIENVMRFYICENDSLKEKFEKSREGQKDDDGESVPKDPNKSGLKGLASFLYGNSDTKVISRALYDDIMILRKKRICLIRDADFKELELGHSDKDAIRFAEDVLQRLKEELD
jgi:hypothetical protein